MSFIGNGGANIYIASGTPNYWTFTWDDSGWQGDTLTQPQPLNTGASMSYTDPSISMNNDGTYAFSYSVSNNGPNSTFYNLQSSSN